MPKSRTLLALPLVLACAAAPEPERSLPPFELIEGVPIYTLLPPDGIPSIDEPGFVAADQADAWMRPEEMVIGVLGGDGTAKCYSAWQLDGHEIVNDTLDGEAIAATW